MKVNALFQDLDAAAVHALVTSGEAVLIDVRERGEFAAERIDGARLHPLSSFDPHSLPGSAGLLILQCGSGKRSAAAMESCRAAGISCLGHLKGGIQAWKAAGLPTCR